MGTTSELEASCRMHSDAAVYVPCQEAVDQPVGVARAALRGNMVDRFAAASSAS